MDSILIDESRTPLIISGKAQQSVEKYYDINKMIPYLRKDEDYVVDEKHHSVTLTDGGVRKCEGRLHIKNLYEPSNIELLHHINQALRAHTLYKKDINYIVKDDKVIIVDEFTGRLMPGRRWSDGLHQAVEAKEHVRIEDENQTLATITFQNYFRMYDKLAGMTGTADTEAGEFHKIYKLDVLVIPTNKPCLREDMTDVIYKTEKEKFNAFMEQITDSYKRGQPVLVGTISVEKSEVISRMLKRQGVPHNVLNAKQHGREAEVVAQAGRKGQITIATNMAGRGTDIVLGGNAEALAHKAASESDEQEFEKAMKHFTEICSKEREQVLKAGGLFILGTERHDSRRIDNQLRGRSGRQGDAGASRFFLSLEDDLMRIFGAERIQKVMDRLGMEDGIPIEHKLVNKAIANAQKRVEGNHFDTRKNLLEYDDVMNLQRKAIYGLRRRVLDGTETREMSLDLFEDVMLAQIDNYCSGSIRQDEWDLEGLESAIKTTFNFDIKFLEASGKDARANIEEAAWKAVEKEYTAKEKDFDYLADKRNERYSESEGYEAITGRVMLMDLEQQTYLREIDNQWRDHLAAMDHLRNSIGLRSYGQRDPKQEYKKEGFSLYEGLMARIQNRVCEYLFKVQVKREEEINTVKQQQPKLMMSENRGGDGGGRGDKTPGQKQKTFVREKPKVKRNDKCPCGSGKKYKKCCIGLENAAQL